MTKSAITILAAPLFCSALCMAQAPAPTLQSLDAAAAAGELALDPTAAKALGNIAFDGASRAPAAVQADDGDSLQPVVKSKPRASDFGEPGDGGGEGDQIGDAIAKALKSKAVQDALDGIRKEQSDKFAKEVVDKVTADPRLKKIAEGPSKTKSVIVQSGIAGAGALMAGIAFATGGTALAFLGLGIMAAGLIGLLVTWLG